MKKNMIIGLLLATSFLIGCGVSNDNKINASEKSYLKELGNNDGYINGTKIIVYSDDENNKLIYTIENGGTVSIAVTDKINKN